MNKDDYNSNAEIVDVVKALVESLETEDGNLMKIWNVNDEFWPIFKSKDYNQENNDFSYILINPNYDLPLKYDDIV